MQRCSLAVLVAGLLLGAGVAQDAPNGDPDKIQGTWKVVSMQTRESVKTGKPVPEDTVKDLKVVISKDRLVLKSLKDPKLERTYKLEKLDPTKKPRWMDLALVQKDGTGKPTGAIYELAGDDLKLCIGDASQDPKRPTDFEVAERGLLLLVLKRDKN
jgi:uncharacterized protein (TIGR03067 family)